MSLTRVAALFGAFLLIIVLSVASIQITQWIGSAITHNSNAMMDGGFIESFDKDGNGFTFKTDEGVIMHFACNTSCVQDKPHLERHISEKAHTNIYYIRTADGNLNIVNID